MKDRERILMNIAAWLANEVATLQRLPAVRQYMANQHSMSDILIEEESYFGDKRLFKKGELVLCKTSSRIQQNPFIISFVEQDGFNSMDKGLLLRAIGTSDTSNYSNESFAVIQGIPERFLWEGEKQAFNIKLHKALAKLDTFIHRFRGLTFPKDGEAIIYIGEYHGGILRTKNGSKPYTIRILYDKHTTIKGIIHEMEAQGLGKREFEEDHGKDDSPFGNPKPITQESLIGSLTAVGIELKSEVINGTAKPTA